MDAKAVLDCKTDVALLELRGAPAAEVAAKEAQLLTTGLPRFLDALWSQVGCFIQNLATDLGRGDG